MSESREKLLHALNALADLGQELSGTSDAAEMARAALHVALGTLAIRRGALARYDRQESSLSFVAARGLAEYALPPTLFAVAELEELRQAGARGSTLLIGEGDGGGGEARLPARLEDYLREIGIELVTPLVVRDDFVGVLLLGGMASGESFTRADRETILSLARHIGVGLYNHRLLHEVEQRADENRRLYHELRDIYHDTVRAFAAAIDCKDRYTQGHSVRVGKYSEIIAREMGWSEERVEGISIAGYLHDVGKLVVDRDIINAPYRIDAKQSSELNRHPAAGYEILTPIRHPYADIPLAARYHHERIDGRGYPEGLKGDEIPMGAKIVTLADSFDAMTTDRPYKRRRDFADVVEDFRRNTGKQFAPEVVINFCHALLKETSGQTKERPIIRMLGKDYVNSEQITPLLSALIVELETGLVTVGNA